MLKTSLGIALLALVALLLGLFVVTDSLLFIWVAIGLSGLAVAVAVIGLIVQVIQKP
jgi:hypothetical protein